MGYHYVIVALYAIPLIPLLVLGLVAFRRVKNFGDPVRHGLIWFHCAIWMYFISVLMMMILMSVVVSPAVSNMKMIGAMAISNVEGIAVLLEMFGFFTLIMSITHLAVGAHQADSQQQSRKFLSFMRILVGLATILYSTYFIYRRWLQAQKPRSNYTRTRIAKDAELAFTNIHRIIMCFLVIATLANVIYASVKYRKNRRHSSEAGTHHSTKGIWALIIAASSVSLVIALWNVFVWALDLGGVDWEAFDDGYWVMYVVDILVEYWFAIVILVLIYLLGKKTIGGLYSGEVPVFKDSRVDGGAGVVV